MPSSVFDVQIKIFNFCSLYLAFIIDSSIHLFTYSFTSIYLSKKTSLNFSNAPLKEMRLTSVNEKILIYNVKHLLIVQIVAY